MGARHFLASPIEDNEVADQVEQSRLFAHLGEGLVKQEPRGGLSGARVLRFPLHEKLLVVPDRAVVKSLGVVACKDELYSGKETFIENLFLVGDELAHAITDANGTAFEFDYANGETVKVQNNIRAAFMPSFKGDFFGKGKSLASGVPQSTR